VDPGDIPTLQQLGLQPLPPPAPATKAKQGGADDSGSPRGGEGEALRQLERFLAGAAARGGGAAGSACTANFSSAVAPWLATGCLSPRRMLEDAQRALAGAAASAGQRGTEPLTWVRFELLWRDFFRFLTMRYSQASLPAAASPAAVPA
jgi:deoxyribodipyrimidine photolyase